MNFEKKIIQRFRDSLPDATCLEELIGMMHGIHPLELDKILDKNDVSSNWKERLRPHLDRSSAPLENPALMQWWFSAPFVDGLVSILAKNRHKRIGLLGCPSIFSRISNFNETIIFDIDQRFTGHKRGIVCDIESYDFSEFLNYFDLVIFDPPWYFQNFIIWSRVANNICVDGGDVVFPIYQENLRPSAESELVSIVSAWRLSRSEVVVLPNAVDYRLPEFERRQLAHFGWKIGNWRIGDLIVAQGKRIGEIETPDTFCDSRVRVADWFCVEHGGIIIAIDQHESATDVKIEFSPLGDDGFLRGPSMRNSDRCRANVLTSKGQALFCSNTKSLLNQIQSGSFDSIDLLFKKGILEQSLEVS